MKRGKQTCKILKDIRRQIAEANDIEFITSECQYQGDCLGTCPKCEAEVRYLEQQLERKRMAGKAINQQPSTINHQPTTINHPSSIIHHPSSINQQPSIIQHPSSIFHLFL